MTQYRITKGNSLLNPREVTLCLVCQEIVRCRDQRVFALLEYNEFVSHVCSQCITGNSETLSANLRIGSERLRKQARFLDMLSKESIEMLDLQIEKPDEIDREFEGWGFED